MAGRSLELQSMLVVGRSCAAALGEERSPFGRPQKMLQANDCLAAMDLVRQVKPDLVVLCRDVPLLDGLQLVQKIKAWAPDTPVISRGDDEAAWVIRLGPSAVFEELQPPLDMAILRLLERGQQDAATDSPESLFLADCPPCVPIVGVSKAMEKVLQTIRLIASTKCNPVLVLGETGTGKELAAKGVHTWRFGSLDNFVAINCATLTSNLLESELFGHTKGSFTGADREKTGLFEIADGGSIFLDEISEMPLDLQAKLLRVLQEKTFRKVGGVKDIKSSAKVIASSNRNLLEEVRKGTFRRDLYYRLAVFPITIPPLRSSQRCSDIPLLARWFIETTGAHLGKDHLRLSPAAEEILLHQSWPGNVRELCNVIERALILEESDEITPQSLLLDSPEGGASEAVGNSPKDFSLEAAEREFIIRALKETGWQRTRAAALLGITRMTLHAKLKRYGIEPPKSAMDADLSDIPPATPAERSQIARGV